MSYESTIDTISDREAKRNYNEHSPIAKARYYLSDLHPERETKKPFFQKKEQSNRYSAIVSSEIIEEVV